VAGTLKPARGSEPAGLSHAWRAFGHRDFRIFWAGALASNVGTWLTNLTVPFVLYQLTHSAVWVGLAALAQFLPGVLFSPLGGSLADRYERRRVLLCTQAGMAVAASGLWLVWTTGAAEPWIILLMVGLAGLFNGLNLPSWQSFVNDLVPRVDLPSAVALNSLQFNAARSLGPAIAGALLATLGPSWTFGLNALSFGFVLAALLAVRVRAEVVDARRSSAFAGLTAAVRYIRRQPGVQVAIAVSVVVGILGNPIFNLTVVFANDVFGIGAAGLGMLNAALGVGALLAAPLVSGGRRGLTRARLVQAAYAAYAVGLVAFAVAPSVVFGVPALILIGASFLVVVSTANTAIQMIVADRLRGRVLAVRIMVFTGSFPVGALLQGWLTDLVGPQWTVAGAGAVFALAAAAVATARGGRLLARLDDPHDDSTGVE